MPTNLHGRQILDNTIPLAKLMVSNIANAQVGMTYTYVTGDREKYITHSNAAAIAGTLPQAGASFPDGWKTYVHNIGAGTLTITPSISTINGALTLVLTTGKSAMIISDGTNYSAFLGASTGGGTGDVVGPASATDNAFARFNTATGKLIKNSQTTEDASGNVVVVGNIRTVREGINKANAGNAMLEILNTAGLQGQQIENDIATRIAFSSFVTADSFVRFTFLGNGRQEWGSGAAVADTNLYRSAVGVLTTDGKIEALTGIKLTNSSTVGYVWKATDTVGNGSWQAGGGGISRSVSSIATNTTGGATASTDYVYLCTATLTLTLPTAVGNTNQYSIKNIGGVTTIATTSAQTIDGSTSATLSIQYGSLTIVSDGANWNII